MEIGDAVNIYPTKSATFGAIMNGEIVDIDSQGVEVAYRFQGTRCRAYIPLTSVSRVEIREATR